MRKLKSEIFAVCAVSGLNFTFAKCFPTAELAVEAPASRKACRRIQDRSYPGSPDVVSWIPSDPDCAGPF